MEYADDLGLFWCDIPECYGRLLNSKSIIIGENLIAQGEQLKTNFTAVVFGPQELEVLRCAHLSRSPGRGVKAEYHQQEN